MDEEQLNNLLYTLQMHHIDGTLVADLIKSHKEQEQLIENMKNFLLRKGMMADFLEESELG